MQLRETSAICSNYSIATAGLYCTPHNFQITPRNYESPGPNNELRQPGYLAWMAAMNEWMKTPIDQVLCAHGRVLGWLQCSNILFAGLDDDTQCNKVNRGNQSARASRRANRLSSSWEGHHHLWNNSICNAHKYIYIYIFIYIYIYGYNNANTMHDVIISWIHKIFALLQRVEKHSYQLVLSEVTSKGWCCKQTQSVTSKNDKIDNEWQIFFEQ